jgi:hypothetical protein
MDNGDSETELARVAATSVPSVCCIQLLEGTSTEPSEESKIHASDNRT